jgi:hypothetical protein
MTDLAVSGTTTGVDDAQRRRLEQLQRKRAVRPVAEPVLSPVPERHTPPSPIPRTTNRRTRQHPAIGARVGAAGLGLVTMFGLVAGMGLAQGSTASGAPVPAAAAPAEVVVVIHRASTTSATDAPTPVATAAAASAPITLTARPTVKAASPSQSTPTAKTNGSR